MDLLKPLEVTVTDVDGNEHQYTISRPPATVAREIIAAYVEGLVPAEGKYKVSHDAMLKLMRYVAVEIDGKLVKLETRALVDNHVPDGEALLRLEIEMMKHNTSFFGNAGGSSFSGFLLSKLEAFVPRIMKIVTASLQQLSRQDSQP